MRTPVALLIFARPDTTERVFSAIRQGKPAKLFVIADGPRPGHAGEAERCAQARAIIDRVDWPCTVLTDYAGTNLGHRKRVSSGLDWVFSTVEEAIILEDDCVPHLTFFQFCDELLEKYRDDARIAQISGINFLLGKKSLPFSYDFSRTPYTWGWATWRRAWNCYDSAMELWPLLRDEGRLPDIFGDARSARALAKPYEKIYRGEPRIWDYQWSFACYTQSMLSIVPNVNLVSNIGFGADASHTLFAGKVAGLPTKAMRFPLMHPPYVMRDSVFERITKETSSPPVAVRIGARVLPQRVKSLALASYSVQSWVDEIVVVDMHSDDRTVAIAESFGARVYTHARVGFADPARAFAIAQCTGEWILILDADELVPAPTSRILQALARAGNYDVIRIPWLNYISGSPLMHTGWGPDQEKHDRFFRKGFLEATAEVHRFLQPTPTARILELPYRPEHVIVHFNCRDVTEFIDKLNHYTTIEATQALARGERSTPARALFQALKTFFGRYIYPKGYRDGWRGFYFSLFMACYRLMIHAKLEELRRIGARDEMEARYQEEAERLLTAYAPDERKGTR
ncbi:MAG: glycosyltransferase family 2 protein [Thermomicrobia bacterium]|nr:glycosyltransferase family 2 protein [Thermomicrobia bacterium]